MRRLLGWWCSQFAISLAPSLRSPPNQVKKVKKPEEDVGITFTAPTSKHFFQQSRFFYIKNYRMFSTLLCSYFNVFFCHNGILSILQNKNWPCLVVVTTSTQGRCFNDNSKLIFQVLVWYGVLLACTRCLIVKRTSMPLLQIEAIANSCIWRYSCANHRDDGKMTLSANNIKQQQLFFCNSNELLLN